MKPISSSFVVFLVVVVVVVGHVIEKEEKEKQRKIYVGFLLKADVRSIVTSPRTTSTHDIKSIVTSGSK